MIPALNMRRKIIVALSGIMIVIVLTAIIGNYLRPTDEMETSDVSQLTNEESIISNTIDTGNKSIDEIMEQMTLKEKVCQMFVVERYDLFDSEDETKTEYITDSYPFGGVIYYEGDMQDPDDVKIFTKRDLHSTDIPMLICVDEEGGNVAHITGNMASDAPNARAFPGASSFFPMLHYKDDSPQVAFDNASAISRDISSYGFNMNFAPCADVSTSIDETMYQDGRCYSNDYEVASALVASAVEGGHDLKSDDGAVRTLNCLKHFPGIGMSDRDTHLSQAIIDKEWDNVLAEELSVFKSGIDAGADCVMMGYGIIPSVSESEAVFSSEWIKILREDLGFDGVTVTDSLSMNFQNRENAAEVALKAMHAGNDLLLCSQDPFQAVDSIVEAVEANEISLSQIDDSVRRILTMKRHAGII